jgi:hypothetical protein
MVIKVLINISIRQGKLFEHFYKRYNQLRFLLLKHGNPALHRTQALLLNAKNAKEKNKR